MTETGGQGGDKPRWNRAVPSQHEQFELKRQAVLIEAGRAFSRAGYHNTSLDDVAEALNVSKPTLYRYFRSKQEILYECHKVALRLGEESVRYASATGSSGLARILTFLEHYVRALGGELGALAALRDQFALAPEQLEEIRARRRAFEDVFRGWVVVGIEDGSVRPCDPATAVACFMGAVNWLPVWFSPEGPRSATEVARTFVDIFEGGLGTHVTRAVHD
jgi:TetR/AcrR family transcriptional regulator